MIMTFILQPRHLASEKQVIFLKPPTKWFLKYNWICKNPENGVSTDFAKHTWVLWLCVNDTLQWSYASLLILPGLFIQVMQGKLIHQWILLCMQYEHNQTAFVPLLYTNKIWNHSLKISQRRNQWRTSMNILSSMVWPTILDQAYYTYPLRFLVSYV